ncbi:MAG: histidine phosphatase family protein [Bacteroidales bacterium]|nr:MAG: histidine phosphatase family protein [Bacteroidales bacterium]
MDGNQINMRLILVRHGETIENIKGICQGQMDGTLSSEGIGQIEKLAERLKTEKIDAIYTSDLKRAIDTASAIIKHHAQTLLNTDKRLRERYFGSYQGKVFPENRKELIVPIDAESDKELFERVTDFYKDISLKHREQEVLIVSHGVTLRTLLAVIQNTSNIESVEPLKNASISIIDIDTQTQFITLNSTAHL